jgi:hypothetical protein
MHRALLVEAMRLNIPEATGTREGRKDVSVNIDDTEVEHKGP